MENDFYRILVVEDNPGDAYLIGEACNIAACGCHRTLVGTASAAWNALSQSAFDLVILDIGLPMENGFELLSRIRHDERLAELPVIVFSDLYGSEPSRARHWGADCVVPKPTDLAAYLDVLSKAVRRFTSGPGRKDNWAAAPHP